MADFADNFFWDPDQSFAGETTDQFFSSLGACEFATFSFNLGEPEKDDDQQDGDGNAGANSTPQGRNAASINRGLRSGLLQGGSFTRRGGSASSIMSGGGGSTGGGAQGKQSLGSLTINKNLDSASPYFFKLCSTGKIVPTLNIALRKQGGERVLYLQYVFRHNEFKSVAWQGGTGSERPTETLTIDFKAMGMLYFPQWAAEGWAGATQPYTWIWNITAPPPSPPEPGAFTSDQTSLTINGEPLDSPFLDPWSDDAGDAYYDPMSRV